jgi:HTH-type transcriptional regulator/antitoxin HigA
METTMIVKQKRIPFRKLPKTYAGLVKCFMPRPIRDKVDAENVGEMMASLVGYELNRDQRDYLKLLVSIYKGWQDSLPRRLPVPPHELVQFMMEQHDMTQADLAKLLGVRQSLVSMMLSGKRAFSKESIKILADRFHINARVLL